MEYKCVLIGASGVGKTSLINRHVTGKFSSRHKPTDRVKVTSLVFHTREGDIKFNMGTCWASQVPRNQSWTHEGR